MLSFSCRAGPSATASSLFARNLGSTLGATILGAVLNLSLGESGREAASDQMRALIEHRSGGGAEAVQAALASGLHLTFWAVFAITIATLLCAMLVPSVAVGGEPDRR